MLIVAYGVLMMIPAAILWMLWQIKKDRDNRREYKR